MAQAIHQLGARTLQRAARSGGHAVAGLSAAMGSISWPRPVIIGTDRPGAGFTFRLIVEWDHPKSTRPVKRASLITGGLLAISTSTSAASGRRSATTDGDRVRRPSPAKASHTPRGCRRPSRPSTRGQAGKEQSGSIHRSLEIDAGRRELGHALYRDPGAAAYEA
jgi:hypothetical protein